MYVQKNLQNVHLVLKESGTFELNGEITIIPCIVEYDGRTFAPIYNISNGKVHINWLPGNPRRVKDITDRDVIKDDDEYELIVAYIEENNLINNTKVFDVLKRYMRDKLKIDTTEKTAVLKESIQLAIHDKISPTDLQYIIAGGDFSPEERYDKLKNLVLSRREHGE
jgi:Zn-finger protein